MKLSEVLWLSAMAVLIIIGIHQTMVNGIGSAYWVIMLAVVLLLIYNLRKSKTATSAEAPDRRKKPKKRSKR